MSFIGDEFPSKNLTRRGLITGLAATAAMAALPVDEAWAKLRLPATRALGFKNLHTNEEIQVTYVRRGRVSPKALRQIAHVLRDWRNDEVHKIDVNLLNQLAYLRRRLHTKAPFEVISGYRSPATNAKLAAENRGVAKKSRHMKGQAIDIRVPGRTLKEVQRAALQMEAGGVGMYSRSNFVHLDTGPFRSWGK